MIAALPLMLGLLGQAAPQASETPDKSAAHLVLMKKQVAAQPVRATGGSEAAFRLLPEPVLRFTNTVGDARDGAIFLWQGEKDGDRPVAGVQVFEHRNGRWYLEFSSFALTPLLAGRSWAPSQAGVEFKPVPGAPKPAETADQRLRQMRTLTEGFSAEDNFEQKSWQKLRMMTKPFARYGRPGAEAVDGALFAYVLTTDPEVYLMLEAREGKNGPEWQFAFAPATIYPVKGLWKGNEVWSLPYREAWTNSRAPFFVQGFQAAP